MIQDDIYGFMGAIHGRADHGARSTSSESHHHTGPGQEEKQNEGAAVAKALFPYVAEHYPYILEESPFVISYNPVAEAWIIEGTLPPGYMGGVFYMALAKHNGQMLMMYGTR